MKNVPFLCCAVLTVSAIAHAAPFRSSKGYSIQPPSGWQVKKGMMGTDVMFLAPARGGGSPNLNVVVMAAPAGTTPRQFKQQVRQQGPAMMARMLNNFKLLRQSDATLGGMGGVRTDATYKMGSPAKSLRLSQAAVLRNGKAYIFTGTAGTADFARYDKAFKAAMASVKWTK